MGGPTLQLRGWMLPVIVALICVPVVAGFLVGGPGVGLAVGAVLAAAILIAAARLRPDEPIEVASHTDQRRNLLVVLLEAIEEPGLATKIAELATPERAPGSDVLVLAPALNRPAAHWASDLRRARFEAQRRLALSLGTLAAARIEARGQVGDTDPVQAVEDTLRTFAADEVAFVTAGDGGSAQQVERISERLAIPVRELAAAGATSGGTPRRSRRGGSRRSAPGRG
jgi:hypothetical protein